MKYFFLLILFFVCDNCFCQNIIRGKVLNEKGEPVPKASVFIPNSTTGTLSDANGLFTLEHTPEGKFTLTVSCIGYELFRVKADAEAPQEFYTCRLKLQPRELDAVVVHGYDKGGWAKWGTIFSDAFIGNSSFAPQCRIVNKDIIRFVYLPKEEALRAYANEPLIIENTALGYRLTVQLTDFLYYTLKKEVDFEMYCFFTPLKGTEDEFVQWKKNREKAYSYSLMYFMRTLYTDNLKNKFEMHRLVRKINVEKKRVQQIYKDRQDYIIDSLNDKQAKEKAVTKLVEKGFAKDSAHYYKEVMEQDDSNDKLYATALTFKDIAHKTDSNTVTLSFEDYLIVTNKRKKEPQEYIDFKNNGNTPVSISSLTTPLPQYPSTEFILTAGTPITINENGYFNNSNLFINGFWSWWEKLATKLPYEYAP